MKRDALLLFILIALAGSLAGQNDLYNLVEQPGEYITPVENTRYDGILKKIKGKDWIVYSDRINNIARVAPDNSSAIKNRLEYLQHYFVTQETGTYLYIIKVENYNFSKAQINGKIIEMGWVPKENLLLWNHCLVKSGSEIDKKAMLMNTIESVKENDLQVDIVEFFKEPELETRASRNSSLYEIFFIYKETSRSLLLGKRPSILIENIGDDIWGWVDKKRVTQWDTRVVVEPNWKPDPALERLNTGFKASAFINKEQAVLYKDRGKPDPFWNDDPFDKRFPGDWRRFPVLSKADNNTSVLLAGVMGEIINEDKDVMSVLEKARIDSMVSKLTTDKRQINIIFVIDGTKSMANYFQPVTESVGQTMSRLKTNIQTYNFFKFGAVVYRDFLEGDRLVELNNLTSDTTEINDFLRNIVASDSKDSDYPEAVFYGLKTALKSIIDSPDNSNFIVLIGDAGNHKRKPIDEFDNTVIEPDEIIDLLVEMNCHLLAFQVNNTGQPSNADFINQSKNLILTAAKKKYSTYKDVAKKISYPMKEPKFINSGQNVMILDSTSVIGKIHSCSLGTSMLPALLKEEIIKSIQFSDYYTNAILMVLFDLIGSYDFNITDKKYADIKNDSVISNYSSFTSQLGPAVLELLVKAGLTNEQIRFLSKKKVQMYYPAYLPLKINGLKYSQYEYSLLLTVNEIVELINVFNKLVYGRTTFERRQNMKNTWYELIIKHIGKISEEEFMNKKLDDIIQVILGVPCVSPFIKDYTPRDIVDTSSPNYLDNIKFEQLVSYIEGKSTRLENIINKKYDYVFITNDTQYYWLEHDLLP